MIILRILSKQNTVVLSTFRASVDRHDFSHLFNVYTHICNVNHQRIHHETLDILIPNNIGYLSNPDQNTPEQSELKQTRPRPRDHRSPTIWIIALRTLTILTGQENYQEIRNDESAIRIDYIVLIYHFFIFDLLYLPQGNWDKIDLCHKSTKNS